MFRILNFSYKPCLQHNREAIATPSSSLNRSTKPRSQPCLEQDRETIDPDYDSDSVVVSSTSAPSQPFMSSTPSMGIWCRGSDAHCCHRSFFLFRLWLNVFFYHSIFFWTTKIEGSSESKWKGSGEDPITLLRPSPIATHKRPEKWNTNLLD